MTQEVYYHNGPSRAWRSELIKTVGSAKSIYSGGAIGLYAAPVYDLPYGVAVSAYIFTVRKAVAPVTYSIASGSLPVGLSLNSSTGVISGTPSVDESISAIFQIVDAVGHIARTSTITFNVGNVITSDLWDQALWDQGVWS